MQPGLKSARPPLAYLVLAALLFAAWAALAVALAVTFALVARDDDEAAVVATATAAPTATPEPRPSTVPLSASPVDGFFDTGDPAQHLFFNVTCRDGVIIVVTLDEKVYGESPCTAPPEVELAPLRGQPVRITVDEGRLDIDDGRGRRFTFSVGRVWVAGY